MEELEVMTETGTESQTSEQSEGREVVTPAQESAEDSTNAGESVEKPKQTAEENRRYADIRRKAEADARAKAQREIDSFFASRYSGKTHNGKAISTRAEAEAYEAAQGAQQAAEARKHQLLEAGVPEELAEALSKDAAQLEKMKAQQAAASAAQQQSAAVSAMEANIAELAKAFPDCGIKSIDDLERHPEVIEQAMRLADGNLVDAYYLAHRTEIEQKRNEAARQAAINSARSGEHHTPTPNGKTADDSVNLSDAELAQWEQFGFTPEQAVKHIKLSRKGK